MLLCALPGVFKLQLFVLQDEYDPAKPNDFEELIKQRQRQQREAEEEAERLARLREVQQVGRGKCLVLEDVLIS